MGKHSASGGTPVPGPPQPTPRIGPSIIERAPGYVRRPTPKPAPPRKPVKPLPSVVQQTIVFGAVAALVTAIALIWSGVNGRTAFLVGLGLLLIGAVAFAVLYRAGLITAPGDAQRTAPPEEHL